MRQKWEYHLRLDLRNEDQAKVYEILQQIRGRGIGRFICECILTCADAGNSGSVKADDLQSLANRIAVLEHAVASRGEKGVSEQTNAEAPQISDEVDDLLCWFFDDQASV